MSENSIVANPTEKFSVVGIITCEEFQKCRYVVNKLHKCFPKQYEQPHIRPMLNVEWEEFLTKKKRKYGNGLWAVAKPLTVFLDGQYLGDDDALVKHISKKFRFTLNMDWYEIGKCHLVEFLKNIMLKFRQLAYITVSINRRVVGTMLFELFNDLVPLACENFLDKCKLKRGGYAGSPIQRIVKNGWIQCGGWTLPEKHARCENYTVPHDRRGVLSMCNSGRHRDNTVQFFITLAPAPWMDYRYVAFGQLLQGAEVLESIECVPTYYERPQMAIDIAMSGEVTFDDTPNFTGFEELHDLQHMPSTALLDCLVGPRNGADPSTVSLISQKDSHRGMHSVESYMRGCRPCAEVDEYFFVANDEKREVDGITESEPSSDKLSQYDSDVYCRSPSFSDITL